MSSFWKRVNRWTLNNMTEVKQLNWNLEDNLFACINTTFLSSKHECRYHMTCTYAELMFYNNVDIKIILENTWENICFNRDRVLCLGIFFKKGLYFILLYVRRLHCAMEQFSKMYVWILNALNLAFVKSRYT